MYVVAVSELYEENNMKKKQLTKYAVLAISLILVIIGDYFIASRMPPFSKNNGVLVYYKQFF